MATLDSLYPHIPRLNLSGVSSPKIVPETYLDRIVLAVKRAIANLCVSILKYFGYPLTEEISSLRKHIAQIPPRTIAPEMLIPEKTSTPRLSGKTIYEFQRMTRSLELEVQELRAIAHSLVQEKSALQTELESEKRRSQSLGEQNEELEDVRRELVEAKKLLAAGNPFASSSVVK